MSNCKIKQKPFISELNIDLFSGLNNHQYISIVSMNEEELNELSNRPIWTESLEGSRIVRVDYDNMNHY